MRAELQLTSFLCVAVLALLVLAQRKTFTFTTTTFICWLLVVNGIQGINASLWAHNLDVHSSVWCDVVTKLTLGATFALPSSVLCVLFHLYRTSASPDKYTLDATTRKPRRLHAFNATFCIILPICYMALHCIVQDRRFVIVEDMGCIPATYPSAVSFAIIWLPLLFVTVASLILFGLTVYNTYRRRHILASGLDRSYMTSPSYHRLLVFSGPVAILAFLFAIFMTAISGAQGFVPWTSWQDVHAHMGEVELRRAIEMGVLEQTQVEMSWWITPLLSLFAVVLLGFGKGTRAGNEELFECTIGRLSQVLRRRSSSLPTHRAHHLNPSSSLSSRTRLTASQSGWDGTFADTKSATSPTLFSFPAPAPTAKPTSLKVDIPSFLSRSVAFQTKHKPTKSIDEGSDAGSAEDARFAESTLAYIGSPTGQRALAGVPPTPMLIPPTPLPPPSPTPSGRPHGHPLSYVSGRPLSYLGNRPPSHISSAGQSLAPRKESDGALSTVSGLSVSDSLLTPSKWPEPPRTVLAHPYAYAAPPPPPLPVVVPAVPRQAAPVRAVELGLPAGVFDEVPMGRERRGKGASAATTVGRPGKAVVPTRSFRYPRAERAAAPKNYAGRGDGIHMTVVKETV